jgi:hypothetical protein
MHSTMAEDPYNPLFGLPPPLPKELVCPITQELMVRLTQMYETPPCI